MKEVQLIEQTFWIKESLKTSETVNNIAKIMAMRTDEFTPTIFYGERFTKRKNSKYEISDVEKFVQAMIAPDVNYIVLTNSDNRKREITFGFTINMLNNFNVISLAVSYNYFSANEKLNKFLSIGRDIVMPMSPLYGKIHDISDSNAIMGDQVFNLLERIPAVFWGNHFGQHYIQKIGREKLLSFNGYKVEELENGDIYIQTSANPIEPILLEKRQDQRELAMVIGIKSRESFTNKIKNIFSNRL